MSFEAFDLKTWAADRVRRTNWVAVGISAALQGGVLAMLIMMGVVPVTTEIRHEKLTVTTIATAPQQPAPASPDAQANTKPVIQPKMDTVIPPTKIQISAAPPVAAAVQRNPDPPTPTAAPAAAPAAAAPAAVAPAAAPAGQSGPITVANLAAGLNCPRPTYPPKANFERQEGLVVIQVVISTEGRVTEASIRRSSGFRLLDEAALTGIRKCRKSPTIRDGRSVEVTGSVNVPFSLRKS